MLITVLEDGKWSYEIADKTKSEYIDTMRLNIKERLVARHKLKIFNGKRRGNNFLIDIHTL